MTLLLALILAQASAHPCMEDARKLCPGVTVGEGKLEACLSAHKDQLSSACSARMAQFKKASDACRADADKFCATAKLGPERMQCMSQHRDQLSPDCQELVAELQQRREKTREARTSCQADVEKFCGGVQPGEGRIIACLKQHQSDLSPACATQMQH
jgi:hypothetical protein